MSDLKIELVIDDGEEVQVIDVKSIINVGKNFLFILKTFKFDDHSIPVSGAGDELSEEDFQTIKSICNQHLRIIK